MKFVSDKTAGDHADQLMAVKDRIAKAKQRLKQLEAEEEQLERFLLKENQNRSFEYNSKDGFVKRFIVGNHRRLILDQDQVLKLLKKRTPYRWSTWRTIKVAHVMEE